ncbi:hypothetical protein EE612_054226, partial [Oryza sativa]
VEKGALPLEISQTGRKLP